MIPPSMALDLYAPRWMPRITPRHGIPGPSRPAGDGERWWEHAACKGENPDLFFVSPQDAPFKVAAAKAICARCPVRTPCLDEAVATGDTWAIRGGTTWQERRGAAPSAPSPWCPSGRHLRTGTNTTPGGRCRPCNREQQHEPASKITANHVSSDERWTLKATQASPSLSDAEAYQAGQVLKHQHFRELGQRSAQSRAKRQAADIARSRNGRAA